jgi:Ser-tRNA(Ala) deacylase AlaX
VLHIGEVSGGSSVKVGDIVRASVDYVRRTRIMPNHTFTHVLNYALRCTTHPWCPPLHVFLLDDRYVPISVRETAGVS